MANFKPTHFWRELTDRDDPPVFIGGILTSKIQYEYLKALNALPDEPGENKLDDIMQGLRFALRISALLVAQVKGDLSLLNPELDGAKWPRIDWSCPEAALSERIDILESLDTKDAAALKDWAFEYYRSSQMDDDEAGN